MKKKTNRGKHWQEKREKKLLAITKEHRERALFKAKKEALARRMQLEYERQIVLKYFTEILTLNGFEVTKKTVLPTK